MLSQMTNKLRVSHDGRSIELGYFDITSNPSAPNRINTCNKHIRTVYHTFTDLMDRGWRQKLTAFYNLATRRVDKIVETPANETGQLHKLNRAN